VTEVIIAIAALVVGIAAGAGFVWQRELSGRSRLRARAEQVLAEAQRERERLVREAEIDARQRLLAAQEEGERAAKQDRDELGRAEKRLRQRETQVERRGEAIAEREREIKSREAETRTAAAEVERLVVEAQAKAREATHELERIAGLTSAQAKEELAKSLEDEARRLAAARVKRIEQETKREADERAKSIIASAIQRFAGGFVAEKTVSVVELPNDEMKGRIIGREGRNIRAIEAATGVDVIIDDTPEVVVISSFNPLRREIARLALERLVADGRIHPARIEEVVQQVKDEIEEMTQRTGEQATFDLGLHGLHPELVKLVGRLRYRSIDAHNLWSHSVVSAEQARRYGEKPEVVNAIRHYHDDEPPTVLAVLLQVADAMSKARPGARRDLLETYVKRLGELERIPLSFKGVERAYAIQAGREVRVMVDYQQVSDDEAVLLSSDIARRIQDTLTYPGEVRVTVIRESRATELAK
jgi:ribonuclease Y